MLLDEPSAHLDPGQQVAMLDLVCGLARSHGRIVVLVLHDLHLALRYADVAIALARGRAVAGPAAEVLRAPVLSAVFGHTLIEIGSGAARALVPA
jgi:iron complex transport system ATP-binding protein